jgi:hypothetical protein
MSLVLMTSCHDALDLVPISEETSEIAYDKASQIEAALVGVYDTYGASEYYVWDRINFQDMRADNNYAGGDATELFSVDLLTITPTNSRLFKHWGNLYDAISKANNVLEKVQLIKDPALTDERRKEIVGEAYFLRAHHYYNLVNLWGGVPLILEFTKSTNPEDLKVPRVTAEQVFEQILLDLDMAISLLPDTYGSDAGINKARATSGAANTLAAKACLQKPNPDYQRALNYLAKVENSKAKYRLIDFEELFDGNHDNNDESILEIQFVGGQEGSYGPQLLLPPSVSGDSWRKFITPSKDLINAFNSVGDNIRLKASVIFESVAWVDEYWGNAVGSSIPFSYKWKNAGGWSSTNNAYLLRFADVIMLKAEALAEMGSLDAAAQEVNRIRKRVSLPDLTATEKATKTSLKKAILKERRLEFAMEGQRWDDLVRFGEMVATMNSLNEIDLRTGSKVNYNMTESKILLPIPQEELDRNEKLVQNP